MLREWVMHNDYQEQLRLRMVDHLFTQGSRVIALDKSIAKLYLLNLDPLLPVVKPLYPDCGRPAINQQGIIRSLVLMLDQQEYSITNWALKVASDPLLFDICGFETDYGPAVASYYDLNVTAAKKVTTTASARGFILTPMPAGDGIVTGKGGSLAILFLM